MTGLPTLSSAQLDELAAGGAGAATIAALSAGQAWKTSLRINSLLERVRRRYPASPLAASAMKQYGVLCEVQQAAPKAVAKLLTYPHVSAWAAHCVRRIREAGPTGDALAADVGHLAAVAGSAAIISGLDLTVAVPVRHGEVALPALGLVRLDPSFEPGSAVLRCRPGAVEVVRGTSATTLPADLRSAAPGWEPVRVLRSGGTLPLRIYLEDCDPFRDCGFLKVAPRLSEDEAARFQHMLDEGWDLLCRDHPTYAPGLAAGLRSLVPLRADPRRRSSAVTSMDAFGAVALTAPRNAEMLAVTLVHEFQHGKLGALLDLGKLYEPDDGPRFFAPWRDDPRPFGALLQGIYAHLGVTDFWRVRRHRAGGPATLAHMEFAHWQEQTLEAARTARDDGPLTGAGRRFMAVLTDQLERWSAEAVPVEPRAHAEAASQDRRVSWRLQWRPDEIDVARLAKAWMSGAANAPSITVRVAHRTHAVPQPANPRLALRYVLVQDPARLDELDGDHEALAREVPGATPADLAYVRNRHDAAIAGYLADISAGHTADSVWSGLALACRHQAESAAASRVLLDSPGLVQAVHQRIRTQHGQSPDPRSLAEWLRTVHVES